MRFKRRAVWLLLVVLLCSIGTVTTVSAHALLVRSNPQANAVLETPPIQVELFFSEPLEPGLSTVRVINSNGLAVDVGDVRVDPSDPKRMTVSLRSLPDGVYTVTWQALSSIDGHQTVGTFPFAVGDVSPGAVSSVRQTTTASLPFTSLASKFLLLVSLALLVGQRLFIALVWEPALRSDEVSRPAIWAVLYRVGLLGVLIGIGLGMLSQAGQATGSELSFPWSRETGQILTETRLGLIWLLRLMLVMFAVLLAARKGSRLRDWLGFGANLGLLLTVTLTSHAATDARPFLPVLGDLLHLVGMTFWLGGLVYLFTGIHRLQQLEGLRSTQLISLLTSRFSVNAIIFVSLIGLTGFYSAYLRLGTWHALLTSLYGRVLLVKQGFVLGLLVIAATNLLFIAPRLELDRILGLANKGLVVRFGKILILDLTFAGLLLASVSLLTYLPPAKIVSPATDLTARTTVDDLEMQISISPGRVGQNTFTLTVTTSGRRPLVSAREVLLRFTPDQADIPPSELQLIGQGDGTFSARGAHLSLPGTWQIQAVVRRADKFDAFANFQFTFRPPGSVQGASILPRQAGLLMLSIALLFALLTASVNAQRILRLGAGVPLTVLMIGLGILFLARPVSVQTEQINPVPPDSNSVAAGQALFMTHCAVCHGETGKGDGPVGLTLNPRPADLTMHAIPGVHTDAQLFEWISDGFPGSSMPAFRSRLSDTDRWNLVNFIRTLAPK